ncbi:MAG: hypothetical protein ACIAXF_11710 [Phycisphaerales bacterium JB063]
MNAFPIRLIDGVWHVCFPGMDLPCSSKEDAEVLAEIPVQISLIPNDSLRQPDEAAVRAIIELSKEYSQLPAKREVRRLAAWLKRASEPQALD